MKTDAHPDKLEPDKWWFCRPKYKLQLITLSAQTQTLQEQSTPPSIQTTEPTGPAMEILVFLPDPLPPWEGRFLLPAGPSYIKIN